MVMRLVILGKRNVIILMPVLGSTKWSVKRVRLK